MRDIRADIKERLESVATKRERLQQALVDLDDEERTLQTLLTAENARFHSREPSLFGPITGVESSITQFLLDAMSDGKAWSLERLKDLAGDRGIFTAANVSLGRVLHMALVGLKRRGIVEQVDDGVWKLVQNDAPSAKTDEAP